MQKNHSIGGSFSIFRVELAHKYSSVYDGLLLLNNAQLTISSLGKSCKIDPNNGQGNS
jgi:hypothetical protein